MLVKRSLFLLLCSLFLIGCQLPVETSWTPPTKPTGLEQVRVLRVIDGDTIVVARHGRKQKVRFLLIDAPEDTKVKEPFGREATLRLRQLLSGKSVQLEYDIERYDRYGRLLAYVYLHGQSVQAQLLTEGLAEVKVYPPNRKYEAAFRKWEAIARHQQRGIWSR